MTRGFFNKKIYCIHKLMWKYLPYEVFMDMFYLQNAATVISCKGLKKWQGIFVFYKNVALKTNSLCLSKIDKEYNKLQHLLIFLKKHQFISIFFSSTSEKYACGGHETILTGLNRCFMLQRFKLCMMHECFFSLMCKLQLKFCTSFLCPVSQGK